MDLKNMYNECSVHCVVPENIHTPTMEGIGNSKGEGGEGSIKDPGNSEGEGGCMIDLVSRGPLIQYRLKC